MLSLYLMRVHKRVNYDLRCCTLSMYVRKHVYKTGSI